MGWTLSALAEKLGLRLTGDDCEVTGVNTLEAAGPGDISFLANVKYAKYLSLSKAAAVIVAEEHAASLPRALVSQNPYLDFSRAVALFAKPQGSFSGISESAYIHPDAVLEHGCTVYPFVYIGARARIAKGCVLFPGCYVGEDCVLGQNCTLYPHATLMAGTVLGSGCVLQPGAVLGADGFGFIREGERVQKIPQIGTVRIGNNVEIGACSAVDRAVLGVTSVGDETKLDNLVQLGHNVTMGKRCFIVSQVGISGSTKVGDDVTMAGQVGVAGHLNIGNGVTIGPKSGVAKDIPDGTTCGGMPTVDGRTYIRTLAVMPKLPDMYKRLGQLEQELAELRALLEKDHS